MRLRPYQQSAVLDCRAALLRSRSVILCAQVGSGKTVMAAEMVRLAVQRGTRAILIAHRIELIDQARDRLRAAGVNAGTIKAGVTPDPTLPVQVASIQTLARRELPQAQLVIADECHRAVSPSWLAVLRQYADRGSYILGLSATPRRLDGKGLGAVFGEIVHSASTADLIAAGHLLEPTVYAPPVDLSGIRTTMGDYSLPQVATRMQKLTGSLTGHWMQLCAAPGSRTLVFATNIAHSLAIVDAFAARGVSAIHVDGTTPITERARTLDALRSGTIQLVSQCALWGEGMDAPELDRLVIARPTLSLSLHRQMIGRVMRPAPGKPHPIVLDHAGNHHRHGAITDDIEWSLEDRARTPRDAVGAVTTCPECYAVFEPGADTCPACGADLTAHNARQRAEIENSGKLVEFRSREARADWYRDKVRLCFERGYKLGWARAQYRARYGTWPKLRKIETQQYSCNGHTWETKRFGPRSVRRCSRCLSTQAD